MPVACFTDEGPKLRDAASLPAIPVYGLFPENSAARQHGRDNRVCTWQVRVTTHEESQFRIDVQRRLGNGVITDTLYKGAYQKLFEPLILGGMRAWLLGT